MTRPVVYVDRDEIKIASRRFTSLEIQGMRYAPWSSDQIAAYEERVKLMARRRWLPSLLRRWMNLPLREVPDRDKTIAQAHIWTEAA